MQIHLSMEKTGNKLGAVSVQAWKFTFLLGVGRERKAEKVNKYRQATSRGEAEVPGSTEDKQE